MWFLYIWFQAFVSKMALGPLEENESEPFYSYTTSDYKLHYFEVETSALILFISSCSHFVFRVLQVIALYLPLSPVIHRARAFASTACKWRFCFSSDFSYALDTRTLLQTCCKIHCTSPAVVNLSLSPG